MPRVGAQPKPDWGPVPRPGCHGVEVRVLLRDDELLIANLRFARETTIDAHAAPWAIEVVVLDGCGRASIGEEVVELAAGQTLHWPADVEHRLWTEDSTLETLMVERIGAAAPAGGAGS